MSLNQQLVDAIEKCTSVDLKAPDMQLISNIVAEINKNDINAKTAAFVLLKRLQTMQPKVMFLSLGLLDMMMDRCNRAFHMAIGQKMVMQTLVQLLSNKQLPKEILGKIISLIQKWGLKFQGDQQIPLFAEVYGALKRSGVAFPPPEEAKPKPAPQSSSGSASGSGMDSVPKKFHKLIADMNLVKGNINLTNEIIDTLPPGERKNEVLQDLYSTLQQMEPKLSDLISQVDNEPVLQVCLLVNDDLQATFKRYEDVQKGRTPSKFVPGECSAKNSLLTPTHIYTTPEEDKPKAPNDLFDFGGASTGQQQMQPQLQQQRSAQQTNQQAADVLSQLNNIMAGMNNPQPQQQQHQMPQQQQQFQAQAYQTSQAMPGMGGQPPMMAQAFQTGAGGGMAMQAMGGFPNQGMQQQQQFQTQQMPQNANANPFGAPPMNNNMGASNPFGGPVAGAGPSASTNNVGGGFGFDMGMSGQGTGAPTSGPNWQKDGIGMDIKGSQQQKDTDNVKEFQDLFGKAFDTFKTTDTKRVDPKSSADQFQYNPLGSMPPAPIASQAADDVPEDDMFSAPMQQQQQQQPANNNFNDPFAMGGSAPSQQQPQADAFAMPAADPQPVAQAQADPFAFSQAPAAMPQQIDAFAMANAQNSEPVAQNNNVNVNDPFAMPAPADDMFAMNNSNQNAGQDFMTQQTTNAVQDPFAFGDAPVAANPDPMMGQQQQQQQPVESFDFGGAGAFDSTMNNAAAAQAVEQLQQQQPQPAQNADSAAQKQDLFDLFN